LAKRGGSGLKVLRVGTRLFMEGGIIRSQLTPTSKGGVLPPETSPLTTFWEKTRKQENPHNLKAGKRGGPSSKRESHLGAVLTVILSPFFKRRESTDEFHEPWMGEVNLRRESQKL